MCVSGNMLFKIRAGRINFFSFFNYFICLKYVLYNIFQSAMWCPGSLLHHFHWLSVSSRLTCCLQCTNATKTLLVNLVLI